MQKKSRMNQAPKLIEIGTYFDARATYLLHVRWIRGNVSDGMPKDIGGKSKTH